MAAPVGLLPARGLLHPAFDPLRSWLSRLGDRPGIEELNALAQSAPVRPVTANGLTVRFCAPGSPGGEHYEKKIFDTGEVVTRPDNLHDLFNALTWLAFPRTKAAMNARHVERIALEGNRRGPLRDLLTLFDEGGVIVACTEGVLPEIEALVRGFHWQALFWDRREALPRETRFVLVGHNAYEKALAPYPGITCKALFTAAPSALLDGDPGLLVTWLDEQAASWVRSLPEQATPRQMAPLPVFGFPGWLAQGADPEFYKDRRWFRAAPPSHPPADKLESRV